MKPKPLVAAAGVLPAVGLWLFVVTIVIASGCGAVVRTAAPAEPVSTGTNPAEAPLLTLHGWVHAGQQPVQNAAIEVYAAGGAGPSSPAQSLLATPVVSEADGSFAIAFSCPTSAAAIYAVATGGGVDSAAGASNSASALMTTLGACGELSGSSAVAINEVTTVASVWAYSAYMSSASKLGSDPNDARFAAAGQVVQQLVKLEQGSSPGSGVPSGYAVQTAKLYDLANALHGCVVSSGGVAGDGSPCGGLLALATPPGATPPEDTLGAALLIAQNPTVNPRGIFALSSGGSPYQPILSQAPEDWSLSLLPVPATPEVSPGGGVYAAGQQVTLAEATPHAVIHYTTDGSNPTASSPVYREPLTLTGTETVNAIAIAEEISSAVASATYSLEPPPMPVFTPGPGAYTTTASIALSDGDASAVLYYTTDGRVPGSSSMRYSGPIGLTASVTLRAIAVHGGLSSAAATGTYIVNPPAIRVTVSPAAVTLESGGSCRFAAAVTGTSNPGVRWSIHPAVGSLSSAGVYTAPASIAGTETVVVTASSVVDPTRSGTATVTLNPASTPASPGFALAGLMSPATVAESIFVYAPGVPSGASVAYALDGRTIASESAAPYWLGGQTGGTPKGYSIKGAGTGRHVLSATAMLADGSRLVSNSVVLNVIPSINASLSGTLASYRNQISAQTSSLETVLAHVTTPGAVLTPQEVQTREAVLTMYMNWGIDPSLDFSEDESEVLASLAPSTWKAPGTPSSGQDLSLGFSPDAPAYQAIPALWPRVALPSGFISTVELNTTVGGDGLGYGQVVASPTDPKLEVHSEWYGVASTLVTFSYPMPADWAARLPWQQGGDAHMIFADPAGQTFVSSYKTTRDAGTGGPDALYASRPTPFNSLGDRGGSTAASFAELPFLIEPGEATDAQKPIGHAIGGALGRTWAARVYPAVGRDAGVLTSTNSCTGQGYTNTGLIPYGGVIQLDPQLDLTRLNLSLPALRILQAMQTYGYYVMDFGCADLDIYSSMSEAELDPYGGLWGYNRKGPGVQNEIQAVLSTSKLYVVAPLIKKQ